MKTKHSDPLFEQFATRCAQFYNELAVSPNIPDRLNRAAWRLSTWTRFQRDVGAMMRQMKRGRQG